MKFAVIETGGKQYHVEEGKVIHVEKLKESEGEEVVFSRVLLLSDNDALVELGTPYVKGKEVKGIVKREGRDKKVVVIKFKNKTRQFTKKGHRQPYTRVLITSIPL